MNERDIPQLNFLSKHSDNVMNDLGKKLATVLNSSPSAMAIISFLEGRYIDVNDSWLDQLGYNKEDVVGKTTSELNIWANPQDRMRVIDMLKNAGVASAVETELKKKDGSIKKVSLSSVIVDLYGRKCVISMTNDLTAPASVDRIKQTPLMFKEILETIPDAYYILSQDGTIICSKSGKVDCGCEKYKREHASEPKNIFEIFPDELRPKFIEIFNNAARSNQPAAFIYHIESTYCEARIIPREGQIAIIFRDVTKRKRIENQLRKNEAKYKSLVEDQSELVCRFTTDSRLTFVNEAYCQYFGKTREELLGSKYYDHLPEEQQSLDKIHLSTFSPDSPTGIIENKTINKNGEMRWIQWVDKAFFTDGKVVEFQSVGRDITERKMAELELARERNLLRTLINLIPDVIFVKDSERRYVISNTAHLRLLGAKTREEVAGKNAFDYHPLDLATRYDEDEKRIVSTGQPIYDREERVYYPHLGEIRWHLSTKVPIFDEDGRVRGLVGICKEITERKKLVEELKEAKDNLEIQVAQRTENLRSANEALEKEILERKRTEKDLVKTNELLEKIFETTNIMLAYLDHNFNYIRVNRAFASIENKDAEYYIGKNHFEIFPDDDNLEIYKNVLRTGRTHTAFSKPFEFASHPELGTTYWDWTLQRVKAESGSNLVLCLVDRTQDNRTEKKLLELYRHLGILNRQVSILLTVNKKCHGKNSKKIMEYITDTAQKLSKAKIVSIYKLDHEASVFNLVAGRIDSKKITIGYSKIPVNNPSILKPLFNGIRSQGTSIDLNLEIFRNDDLKYFLALPLSSNKKPDGMLFLGFDDRTEISTQELEFYEAFAAQVSLAMESYNMMKQCRLKLPG